MKIMNYLVKEQNKLNWKFKIKAPKNIWTDKPHCLRSEMYSFKGGNISENILKGISKN